MNDPTVAAEIDDPERREEAIWSMCRNWQDVIPYDPAYLLGPRKKRLRWPAGGPWSYQVVPHPSDPVQQSQGPNDAGQHGGPTNDDKESGNGQNWLEFSSPTKILAGDVQRLGHDAVNRLGSVINHVKVPSTEDFAGIDPAIREPAPVKLPLL